ncbi:PAS domain S-box protein [Sphingomonas parva]|uniref:histidine kinase n=1 Tax=Sphingomonas parva TaxID=2555898 RepID=A0A4Y8ZKZ2_9SPHN|nr:PAS domain-containing protein [Sphingomonas parva]TFI56673.1 PAS domain S-box protein [Sphingomonas parva]
MADVEARSELDGGADPCAPAVPPPYALIVESMSEGVSLSTEDGIIVYTNAAEDRLFGYARGELIGRHVSVQNAYPEEENAARVAEVIEALRAHGRWEGEWHNRRKNGSSFHTASRITAVDIDGGRHWLCVQRDVTAERTAEARLRVAMEAGKLGSWWFDPERGVGGWSDYSARMLGLSSAGREVSYEEWRGIVYPADRAGAEAAFAAALAGESDGYDTEYRVVHATGAVRRLRAVGAVEHGADGRARYVVGTFRDITEERSAREALEDTATRLDLAVTAHGIGIFDWYVQTGKVLWTPQEESLFGLPPGSFGGSIDNWAERLLPEDAASMQARLELAMAERRERIDFAFRIRRPDGAVRWIEGSGHFLYAEDGTPLRMVGTNMDVTDRRQAEQHQRLLVNELNHRVKNTLAIVQGIAHQSFRGSGMPSEARDAFEGRLAALSAAHNLLTRESWEAASIGQVVADAAAPLAAGRISTAGPELRLSPKTAVALALAVHELCTNAAKYGALQVPEGRVDVDWSVDGDRLFFRWRERGGPPVEPPARRGFGTRMIERALAAEFGGTATIDFAPGGVICTLEAELSS